VSKRLKIAVCAIAVVAIVVIIAFFLFVLMLASPQRQPRATPLYRAARNYVQEQGEGIVTLADLTDFDWEKAVYFRVTNPTAIHEIAGVWFTQTDLTTGLLFVYQGEIVHYEFLPYRVDGMIDRYPVRITLSGANQRAQVFSPYDQFKLIRGECHFGNPIYRLQVCRA